MVITIVILIILATVAMSYVFGENGLITKAELAKEQTEIESLIERMELAEGSAYIDGRGTIDPDKYFDLLYSDGIILSTEEPDVIDNEDGTYQITTEEGYVFEITLLPDKENPTNIEIEYIGKENNLGPRIREIRITGRTTNSVSIEVETRNAEGASYTYTYKEAGTGEWKEAETSENNTCTIKGLEAGKAYEIQVKVETENGEVTEEIGVTIGELPEGTIKFGETEWVGDGTARITIETSESGYTLQYQKNGTEGSWTTITSGGIIENLSHGDTVYARLWDGTNGSEHASASIEDDIAPEVEISTSNVTSSSVTLNVTASDAQSGLATSGTYKYYLENELKQTSTTNSYTFTELADGTEYTLKVAVTDKAGKETEKSTTITTETVPAGTVTGAITFGNTTWSNGTASVKVNTNTSYTIEYQVNGTSGTWTTIANGGTISGRSHGDTVYARLTDGSNAGAHASVDITDDIAPTVSISTSNLTSNSAKLNVTASDAQSGLATSGTYKYYLGNELKQTSTTNSYTFSGLSYGTQYTLKVVVTDKAGKTTEKSTTITTPNTVKDVLEEGNYVKYVDKTGVTRTCIVLYGPENANYSSYGIQIITMETVEDVELGNGTGSGTANSDEELFEIGKNSYNNLIGTLNTRAEGYLNTTYASAARSVGSVPDNPNSEAQLLTSDYSWFDNSGMIRDEDENYLADVNQMRTLDDIIAVGEEYWLASRSNSIMSVKGSFYMRYVYTSGTVGGISVLDASSTIVHSRSYTKGLRPVFTLKTGIKVIGGNGEETSPYTLGT